MTKPTIAILMSTYNGEKYLAQQIDSIRKQSYKNWCLMIRDDGSSDDTVKIIEKYQSEDNRIEFLNQGAIRNVGVVRSFFELLRETEADFYMFSDQDDYWLPNKVELALQEILKLDNSQPNCVYTNLQIVDKDLNGKELLLKRNWQSFTKVLFTNNVYGCTMMINNSLKKMVNFKQIDYQRIYMHDWWLALIAAEFGNLRFIDKATILYRQHGSNQVGATDKSFSALLQRLFNHERDKKAMQRSVNFAIEFLKEYGNNKNLIDENYINRYGKLDKESSFFNNLRLVLKLPPKSIYRLKEIFYSFILVIYYRDYLIK
ncbi:glycosyltransferase family 2 protein [Weissella confusa]|uniref:Glycosyltransferase family 2 protein n=1 Tax=Limosilactobacillus reuteri TaxID=1598 RepID=A0A2T5Q3X1_LIMRT|nr:glycosyltransferase family 2 protein [Limosilactobacillus reuteri]MCW3763737.1 glycosyltransferase family 2 protein [Weissella confusa]PTV04117.1 glycosyltransferase family 2 protein [Limosilactobacillus reuteri]